MVRHGPQHRLNLVDGERRVPVMNDCMAIRANRS